jgi:hypothetical protein
MKKLNHPSGCVQLTFVKANKLSLCGSMKSQRNQRGKSSALPDSPCVPFIGKEMQEDDPVRCQQPLSNAESVH